MLWLFPYKERLSFPVVISGGQGPAAAVRHGDQTTRGNDWGSKVYCTAVCACVIRDWSRYIHGQAGLSAHGCGVVLQCIKLASPVQHKRAANTWLHVTDYWFLWIRKMTGQDSTAWCNIFKATQSGVKRADCWVSFPCRQIPMLRVNGSGPCQRTGLVFDFDWYYTIWAQDWRTPPLAHSYLGSTPVSRSPVKHKWLQMMDGKRLNSQLSCIRNLHSDGTISNLTCSLTVFCSSM